MREANKADTYALCCLTASLAQALKEEYKQQVKAVSGNNYMSAMYVQTKCIPVVKCPSVFAVHFLLNNITFLQFELHNCHMRAGEIEKSGVKMEPSVYRGSSGLVHNSCRLLGAQFAYSAWHTWALSLQTMRTLQKDTQNTKVQSTFYRILLQ